MVAGNSYICVMINVYISGMDGANSFTSFGKTILIPYHFFPIVFSL